MRISVFGIGYVGAVTSACLAHDGHHVIGVDVSAQKVETLSQGRSPIVEAGLDELLAEGVKAGLLTAITDADAAVAATELSIVCVGTPSASNGNLDLGHVARVCESIGRALGRKTESHVVVIRSTMLPGSVESVVIPALERASGKRRGQGFEVVYYPEFLREGSALKDYYDAGVIVFGIVDGGGEAAARALVAPIGGELFITSYGVAESAKYANNAWHAAKIVFANEIGAFCQANRIDSHEVMLLVCADKRLNISPVYLRPGYAYGGSCLPKDLRALRHRAREHDVELPLLESLAASNQLQIRRAFDMVREAGHRRVGLIGLSFKAGTDDLRESPAVELAEMLFGKGHQLRIYDRNVVYSRLTGANLSFIQSHIPHLAELLTDDFQGVVDFAETLVVLSNDFGDNDFSAMRPDQAMIDLIRLAPALRPAQGSYRGLGW